MANGDGWEKWQEHVLAELKRLNENYETIDCKVDKVCVDIAGLKVKSGIWGAVAGAIPASIIAFYLLIKNKLGV